MMRQTLLASLLALVTLAACAAEPAASFNPSQLRDFQRDTLTIERRDGRDQFTIWLAATPAQQEQGLMWIRQLPRDHGMLFVLGAPRPMNMWMKNTYVPLDMLFFDDAGRITRIEHDATPLSERIIESGGDVAGVLEIAGGEARRRGINTGDRILHRTFRSVR